MISKSNEADPEEALKEIHTQQAMLATAIDTQVCLQLMIAKGLVTAEEIGDMRLKVAQLPKYKVTLEKLEEEEKTMRMAVDHPDQYQSALLKHKMDELLKGRR